MSKLHTTIHDHFIRAILSDKEIATDYFQNYLPHFVSEKLDLSSLTQIPDTYLSDELKKTMSDIVYTCITKDTNEEVKVTLLIEHKSHPDKNTPVQIGHYIFSGLQKQLQNKERLSVIIPVLLYHGKGKWVYQKLSGLFKTQFPGWNQFIPDFDYIYNNLGDIPDEQVESLNNKFLAASLLALKHRFQKDWLQRNALRILLLTEQAPKNLQSNLVVYLFGNGILNEQRVDEIIDLLTFNVKDTIMNTLERIEQKGVKRGIEIGERKNRDEMIRNLIRISALTDEQIASVAGVTIDFVSSFRSATDMQQ